MSAHLRHARRIAGAIAVVALLLVAVAQPQANQRSFPQSKAAVEQALKKIQANMAGRLPILEGFAKPGEHPLDHYGRGYYQATAQVTSSPSGDSVVRVSAKVTAWYNDPVAARSGYRLLVSNGRIESDLLDQLAEQLASSAPEAGSSTALVSSPKSTAGSPSGSQPEISAPAPAFPETGRTFPSSVAQGLSSTENAELTSDQKNSEKPNRALQAEADSLEEVLKNQAHPKNLVAVKKSGTPVVATPSLNAKPEFLASQHDEFELLNFTADWVHVRISGLSRGWIWRNSVEMPDGIADTDAPPASGVMDLFHVVREETAPFPGNWEPLRSQNVKIISVQKVDGKAQEAGPKERLAYAKSLLEKSYVEMTQKQQDAAGVVVIFDSSDGGMIAATTLTLQQWRAGALSDSALWHKCLLDPPETFDAAAPSGSQ